MARTKQAPRRSTGVKFPRLQLATRRSISNYDDENKNQNILANIYNSTGTRTIAVVGLDELQVKPDIVMLSFIIEEEKEDFQEAINEVLTRLSDGRQRLLHLGMPNENICCDALQVSERLVKMVNGLVVNDDSDDEGVEEKIPSVKEKIPKISLFTAMIVIRLRLEGEKVMLFGMLMLSMAEMGIVSHRTPVYETSELTARRHEARKNAVINAWEKAEILLSGFDDPELVLGAPLTVNDIPVDITDDAASNFIGNSKPWFMFADTRLRKGTDSLAEATDEEGSAKKKRRVEFMQTHMQDLFVVPYIRVGANVQVVFEILNGSSNEVVENEHIDENENGNIN